MKIFRWFLLPFSFIYGIIVLIRNLLFDVGFFKSQKFNKPIILVGNLSTGGTGKTPMVKKISELLGETCKPVILSRGYKRKTKGLIFADDSKGTVEELGDEPSMYHHSMPYSKVVVCEDRVKAIREIEIKYSDACAVIMDDGYQHRYVDPGLKIILTPFNNLYVNDYLIPVGSLRENRSGASRANVIVITKCPEFLNEEEKDIIKKKLNPLSDQELFFSSIKYGDLINKDNENIVDIDSLQNHTILLVSGIANPYPLEKELLKRSAKLKHLKFADHHQFSRKDIENIRSEFKSLDGDKKIIVTTEKDIQRLVDAGIDDMSSDFYFIPITVSIDDEYRFKKIISTYVGKN